MTGFNEEELLWTTSARTTMVAIVWLALAAGGCSTTAEDGTPIVTDGSLVGFITETANPGSTYKARQAADDAKCREFGFTPGTDAYGNCRLQLEQIRATRAASGRTMTCRAYGDVVRCN